MTLTERKSHPEITAMMAQALTQPEMEEATGGDFNWKLLALCDTLGIHDFQFSHYEYERHPLCGFMEYPIFMCTRCGKQEKKRGQWIIGEEMPNQ